MNLKDAYDEACKCGFIGSILDYALSVGVKVEDLPEIQKEGEKTD